MDKYLAEFNAESVQDINKAGDAYRLTISHEDYLDEPFEMILASRSVVKRSAANEDKLFGVREVEINISFVGTDTIGAKDLYTANPMNTVVRLTNLANTETFFIGRLISDDVSEPYEDGLRDISVTAKDGLESLKTVDFEPLGEGLTATGQETLFEIVRYCLLRTELNLPMLFQYPYYPASETLDSAYTTLSRVRVYMDIFDKLNCFEVLERICSTLNLKIEQTKGQWEIVHAIPKHQGVRYFQRYDYLGTLIDTGVYANDVSALHNTPLQPANGNLTLLQAVKEHKTELEVTKEGINLLTNGDFENDLTGWNNWKDNHPVDSYAFGGVPKSKKNPKYLQINGFQPKTLFDDKTIGGIAIIDPITIMAEGEDPREKLDISLKFSVQVKGMNVQKAHAFVFVHLRTNIPLIPFVTLIMNDAGDFTRIQLVNPNLALIFGLAGVINELGFKKKIIPNGISVATIDNNNKNKAEYTRVSVESKMLNSSLIEMNILEKISGSGGLFQKITVDNITSVEVGVVLSEGHIRKQNPSNSERWVRWANAKLQVIDKARGVGLQKNIYSSKLDNGATVVLEKKAYFGDWFDTSNFTSLTKLDGSPIGLWLHSSYPETGDILMLLNKELLSIRSFAAPVYDGNILGYLEQFARVTMLNYEYRLLIANYTFDFGNNVFDGRLIQTIDDLVDSEDTKLAYFDEETQLEYTEGELDPPSNVDEETETSANVANIGMENVSSTDLIFNGFAIENEYNEDGDVIDVRLTFFNPSTGDVIFQIGNNEGEPSFFDSEGEPIPIGSGGGGGGGYVPFNPFANDDWVLTPRLAYYEVDTFEKIPTGGAINEWMQYGDKLNYLKLGDAFVYAKTDYEFGGVDAPVFGTLELRSADGNESGLIIRSVPNQYDLADYVPPLLEFFNNTRFKLAFGLLPLTNENSSLSIGLVHDIQNLDITFPANFSPMPSTGIFGVWVTFNGGTNLAYVHYRSPSNFAIDFTSVAIPYSSSVDAYYNIVIHNVGHLATEDIEVSIYETIGSGTPTEIYNEVIPTSSWGYIGTPTILAYDSGTGYSEGNFDGLIGIIDYIKLYAEIGGEVDFEAGGGGTPPTPTSELRWIDYATGAYGEPTEVDEIAGSGKVFAYEYNEGAVVKYRFVPFSITGDDAFYDAYDLGTQTLSGKIISKQITI